MHPQLNKAIDEAIAKGNPPRYIAFELIEAGWPAPVVHEALDTWLVTHDISFEQRVKFDAWLAAYVKSAFVTVLKLDVLSVLLCIMLIVGVYAIKIAVDSIFGSIPAPGPLANMTHSSNLLLLIGGALLIIFLLVQSLKALYEASLTKHSLKLDNKLRMAYFRHILSLPMTHQENLAKGDYHYRQDVVGDNLSAVVIATPALTFGSLGQTSLIIVILALIDYKLAIIALFVPLASWVVFFLTDPSVEQKAEDYQRTRTQTNEHLVEAIDNAETAQAFMLEDKLVEKLLNIWDKNYRALLKNLRWVNLSESIYLGIVVVSILAITYVGGTQTLHYSLSLGSLIACILLTCLLLKPTRQFFAQRLERARKRKELERIYEIICDHAGIENGPEKVYQLELSGKIDFNFVSYNINGKLVLQDVNLHIQPGQKVAIIGAEGTGRSTILKLLAGFTSPSAGNILLDGQDITSIPRHELHHNIAWIGQNPQLFSKTIVENILDGDVTREINVAEMMRATDAAHVPEFVHDLPLKFNSPVGPKGVKLSYSQRHRIAIARALANDAPIICMDEPAMVEPGENAERLIVDAVHSLINNRTVLLVTRRPSILALMDEVFVIEGNQLRNVREYGGYELYLHYLQAHEQV